MRTTAISRSNRRCRAASHGNRIWSRNCCGKNPVVISNEKPSDQRCSGPGSRTPRIRPAAIG